jgi:hypothetical protein
MAKPPSQPKSIVKVAAPSRTVIDFILYITATGGNMCDTEITTAHGTLLSFARHDD